MHVEPFEMERFQSLWENVVNYNLSESGVHPLKLEDLLNEDQLRELLQINIGYNQTNGTESLRATIAQLYSGASIDNILVTTGSSEANFLSIWCLIEPGDELALMLPNYMQIWGIANAFGARVKPFHLISKKGRWQIDWEELESVVHVHRQAAVVAQCPYSLALTWHCETIGDELHFAPLIWPPGAITASRIHRLLHTVHCNRKPMYTYPAGGVLVIPHHLSHRRSDTAARIMIGCVIVVAIGNTDKRLAPLALNQRRATNI